MSNCGEPDTENLTRRIFSSLSDVERPHCVFASGTQPMGNAGYGSAALRDAVPHELLELLDWKRKSPTSGPICDPIEMSESQIVSKPSVSNASMKSGGTPAADRGVVLSHAIQHVVVRPFILTAEVCGSVSRGHLGQLVVIRMASPELRPF